MTDAQTELSEAEAEAQEDYVREFIHNYAGTMLWANTIEIANGEPTGETVYPEDWQSPADGWQLDAFTPASQSLITADCRDFVAGNWSDLQSLDAGESGHDFALSRNGHGAGFFDRGYGETGDRLQDAARVYGESGAWFAQSDYGSLVQLDSEPATVAEKEAGE